MADTGVVVGDFTSILTDMGVTVSYKVVTRTTDNMTGEETTSFAGASNVTVIFFLEEDKYVWDKSGLIKKGDAYIIAPIGVGIKRYDQFTYNSQTYYIENVTQRKVTGVTMCDFANVFKVA